MTSEDTIQSDNEAKKQKLIKSSADRLNILSGLLDACGAMKKTSRSGEYARWGTYKATLQETINMLTAEHQALQNHIFSDQKKNPLETFVEAQESEIAELKKTNDRLEKQIAKLRAEIEKLEKLIEAMETLKP